MSKMQSVSKLFLLLVVILGGLFLVQQRMVGVEALLRWRHPEHGLMDPSRFIGLAEEAGFISSLSDWVLAEACRQLACWHAAELPRFVQAA